MRGGIGIAALAVLASAGCTQSQTTKSSATRIAPDQVAALASKGFALFTCEQLAEAAGDIPEKKRQDLFDRGRAAFASYIDEAKASANDPARDKAISQKVPMIVLMHLGGPTTDFMVGRIFEATTTSVEDELYERSSWTHQAIDPKATPPSAEMVKPHAAQRYRERNCDLI